MNFCKKSSTELITFCFALNYWLNFQKKKNKKNKKREKKSNSKQSNSLSSLAAANSKKKKKKEKFHSQQKRKMKFLKINNEVTNTTIREFILKSICSANKKFINKQKKRKKNKQNFFFLHATNALHKYKHLLQNMPMQNF